MHFLQDNKKRQNIWRPQSQKKKKKTRATLLKEGMKEKGYLCL